MSALPPSGSIGLVAINGVAGVAIGAAEWLEEKIQRKPFQRYEHAFILDDDPAERDSIAWVIEAEPGGVRDVKLLSEYAGRKVLWLPCPPQYSAAMIAAAEQYIGIPYAYTDYAAVAGHVLHFDPAHLDERIAGNLHRVMCSQLVVACAQKAGWALVPPGAVPGFYTPDDLADLAPAGAQPEVI